ncbi:MAG TPA: aminoglycoside phosphotransferase family protein [Actinomycetospora sp.]|uniref:aminoglycoside phosphotransferase family protein n=1 Tax=Actinomycetospora sp. TaxID=1872135 RepID=UPI002F4300B3
MSVAILTAADGSTRFVLKVARSEEAAAELRHQRTVLDTLRADPALRGLRDMLPEVLRLERSRDGAPVVGVETLLPGTTLEALLSTGPEPPTRLLTPTIETIRTLHERSGRVETIRTAHLRDWVDAPLGRLRGTCRTLAPASVDAVDQLGRQLHDALTGRRVLVSWTHGDFTPGNVLLDEGSHHVTGIVDWAGGRPRQLAPTDEHTMLLAAEALRRRRSIGAVVTEQLGGLAPGDGLLSLQDDPRSRPARAQGLDVRTLTLLSWLRHVEEMQRKSVRYRAHRVWWALNVEPVLWAVSVGPRPRHAAG